MKGKAKSKKVKDLKAKVMDNLGLIIVGVVVLALGGVLLFSNSDTSTDDESYSDDQSVVVDDDTEEEETTESEDLSNLTQVDADEFAALVDADEYSVLYIMSASCGYCEMMSPIMNEVAGEYDLDVYYIDLSTLTTDSEQATFYYSHDYFMTGIGTPTTVIMKNGGMYGVLAGYVEEESLVSFFSEHGIIE